MSVDSVPRRALQHSGWLHKEGHRVNTAFKRRWFTLTTDRRLSYYESEAAAGRGQKPKGVVHVCSLAHACPRDISGAIDARPREHHAHAGLLARAFTFQTDEAKPFVVFAESTREKVTWLQALLSGLGGSSLALPVEQLATLRRPSELGPPQLSSVASSSSDEAAQRKKAPLAGCGGSEEEEGGREAVARGAAPSRAIYADSERLTAHESPHESQLSEAFLWLKLDLALAQAARGEAEEARATLTSVLGGYHERAGEGLPFPAGLSEEGTMHDLYKPEWLVALHELGKLECAEGRYADAAPSFQGALRIAPPERRTQLRLQCAWCAWHMRLDEPAESLYARELRRDPLCWAALLDRARFRLERAAWGLALSDLELVVAMGQAAADVLNDLGVCRFELGEPGKAMEDFEAALERDEQHAHATLNRGNCHRLAGRLAEARADYSRATCLGPRLVAAFNNRGALSLVEGRHADAVADLEQAARIDPHSEVALQNCELAAAASERPGATLNERVGVTSVLRPDEAADLLAAREAKVGVARRASLSGRQLASSG